MLEVEIRPAIRTLAYALLPLRLMFEALHLVFQAQLQLLQADFFQFFVVGEVSLLSEGFKPLGVLRMLLNQSLKFVVTGQEMSLVESASLPDLLGFLLLLG